MMFEKGWFNGSVYAPLAIHAPHLIYRIDHDITARRLNPIYPMGSAKEYATDKPTVLCCCVGDN